MNEYFWLFIIISLLLYVGVRAFERWVLPKFYNPNETTEQREEALRKQVDDLERRLKESERKNEELEANQRLLLGELGKANVEIREQEKRTAILADRVKELEKTSSPISLPITPVETKLFTGRVLGVWPDSFPLDIAGEKDAISSTGLEYEVLENEFATRRGIVEQLSQRDYSILEIGARGGVEGIKLHDGIAPPRWWAQLARQHHIEIFIVLANESSKPGVTNVADELYNVGVGAVVSVDSKINDVDAVEFARMLYKRLSRGVPLAKAVDYAKLVISSMGSDEIKLRERGNERQ